MEFLLCTGWKEIFGLVHHMSDSIPSPSLDETAARLNFKIKVRLLHCILLIKLIQGS